MTTADIFRMLLASNTLAVSFHLPSFYKLREVEKLKRDLSNYKVRNKELYQPTYGECSLQFDVDRNPDNSWNFKVSLTSNNPRAKEWDNITFVGES